ncbi:hypothetical protein SSP35_22_01010 [Streptomyces sp. NBRC 110611]|uniref:hypothetical protein n=1 Tax=Streptomyces sp. NBRC 110611 TaxID=1621259 RepID=UPI0008336BDA|nr:hypothetical protein [Streptomyces sp. NBRC 110611]GAU70797.1 hypothetical protein SSP35_22_01010 [Streptomyces sp. NBRC 110611]
MKVSDRCEADDERDYERVVDRALNSPQIRQAMRSAAGTVNAERLRAQALAARAEISAAAEREYRHYARLRAVRDRTTDAHQGPVGDGRRGSGHGLLGALGFLVPALAFIAALLFLLFGYGLRVVSPRSHTAEGLVTAGWVAVGLAALAALLGFAGMVVTAVRNRAVAYADRASDADPALVAGRDAWHTALLERGVLPFLQARLRDLGVTGVTGADEAAEPGFCSPGFGSPGFTGPDNR